MRREETTNHCRCSSQVARTSGWLENSDGPSVQISGLATGASHAAFNDTGLMNRDFDPNARSFSSLSVKDLLDARDAYHVHLCHLDNVFATAIGRFLIR